MFKINDMERLALMGIRFVDGGDPAGGGGTDPAPTDPKPTDPAPTDPKPADPKGAPSNTETDAQKVARLEADVQRLEREKQDARVKKEGEIKKEAQRKQLLSMAEATGIKIDDPDKETVESLYQKLTGKVMEGDQQTEQTSEELKATKLELAVYRLAGTEKVDAEKLNNRVSFVKAAAALDPSAGDFNDKLKALIEQEAKNDPSIKVSGGTTTSGADQYGGAGGGQEVTKEQFEKMSISERTDLFRKNPTLFDKLANG